MVRHSREIISQGRRYDALLVMVEGIAVRYRILRDGSALTETVLGCIPFRALASLFEGHPRLAAAVFWSFSSETAIYIEHLTDVGRRTALERVAHFLLELRVRFRSIGLGDARSFPMPLTQELLADALGLSVPHVNRTLRQLRDDDLGRLRPLDLFRCRRR